MDILSVYKTALLRRLPLLLVVSFLLAGAAYLITNRLGPTYEVHFSYLISLSEREDSADYTFDGYYALQATDLFAATLARWATTPEIVIQAYETADLEVMTDNPRALARDIEAEKTAPQLVQVTVRAKDSKRVEQLAAGLQQVIVDNVALYHDQGIPALTFRIVPTESWTGVQRPATALIVIAVFAATFILLANAILLMESLKHVEPKR